jgi:hypothetical protein
VIVPPKKNYIPQFLKQWDINSYYLLPGSPYSSLTFWNGPSACWVDKKLFYPIQYFRNKKPIVGGQKSPFVR